MSQAAKAVRRARSTLNRDIANGKVSVSRTGTGQPYIELAELERAYGKVDLRTVRTLTEAVPNGHDQTAERDSDPAILRRELDLLRQEREREREDAHQTIDDLRRRLESEAEERRRLTMVLADMRAKSDTASGAPLAPARRSWWRWGRRG